MAYSDATKGRMQRCNGDAASPGSEKSGWEGSRRLFSSLAPQRQQKQTVCRQCPTPSPSTLLAPQLPLRILTSQYSPTGHVICRTWIPALLSPPDCTAQRWFIMISARLERCVIFFNSKTCLPATISSLQHHKQSHIQFTPLLYLA